MSEEFPVFGIIIFFIATFIGAGLILQASPGGLGWYSSNETIHISDKFTSTSAWGFTIIAHGGVYYPNRPEIYSDLKVGQDYNVRVATFFTSPGSRVIIGVI